MDDAEVKYNQLLQYKTRQSKSPEEEQLIALVAQLEQAKSKIATLSKQSKSKTDDKGRKGKGKQGEQSPKGGQGKDKSGGPRKCKELPKWRYKRIGNQTKHTVNGKTYYWCDYHGYCWCEHETPDCKAKKWAEAAEKDTDKGTEKNKNNGQTNMSQGTC
jgi:hypothetical protein